MYGANMIRGRYCIVGLVFVVLTVVVSGCGVHAPTAPDNSLPDAVGWVFLCGGVAPFLLAQTTVGWNHLADSNFLLLIGSLKIGTH